MKKPSLICIKALTRVEQMPERRESDMMMDYISLAGFILAVFVAGIAFGKFAEKIDRLIRKLEEEEHIDAQKNDRR